VKGVEIGFNTIEDLQRKADQRHILQGMALPRRKNALRNFHVASLEGTPVTLAEGAIVSIRGYVVGVPHVRRSDQNSCNPTAGRSSRDYVLNVGELAGDTEFDSIIAVITATIREVPDTSGEKPADGKWDLEKLRRIAREPSMIRVTGQLFYDSKHIVNSDPEADLENEPRRLSLWEIHPVTAIDVCRMKNQSGCRGAKASFESLEESR
jgi:hypothetical protein